MIERETRLLVISPTSDITPDQLTRFLHAMDLPITIKETCYGAMVEGDPDTIHRVVDGARALDHNKIFSKRRGYPIGDTRRCRAHHGSRPGFTQLEAEWHDLGRIELGLDCCDRGESVPEPTVDHRVPINRLREIIKEVTE